MFRNLQYLVASIFLFSLISLAEAAPLNIDFESPTYSIGALAGQDGWTVAGDVVSSGLTRFGSVAGSQSAKEAPNMARSVSSAIESITPFSFLWDWSPTVTGNSRFTEYEFTVSGTRIAKFGADLRGGVDTRFYAFGLVGGSTTFFDQTETGVVQPLVSVTGVLDFGALTYDVTYTDLGTNAAFSFTGLNMLSAPTLADAQAGTVFKTTANVEGNHYLDNLALGVPEPTTIMILSSSLLSLAFIRRRR